MVTLMTDRAWKKPAYTIGRFFANGKRLFESLEDPDRGLTKDMPLEEIRKKKVYGETAIPSGTYDVILSVSEKFKKKSWAKKYDGLVPEIVGVPGYSGVRIHPANEAKELLGCIAPGENKAVGKVLNSQKRYFELMDNYLMPAHKNGEKMKIIVK